MIDIVMATYNGEKYIAEQIDSILNQTYKDIRIIIRDDGSIDNTLSIIEKYATKYPEKFYIVHDNVKCGNSKSNFMQAMKYSTADYVMFSDQDDFWLPDKISHTLDKMVEIEKKVGECVPVLVFGSYLPVDEALKEIKEQNNGRQEAEYKLSFNNLLVQNYVNGCLMMINRSLLDLMGDYDESILMHDWWAALIASSCGEIQHIDEIMMLYRQHGDNVVGSVNVKSLSYRINKMLAPETKKASKLYLSQAKLLQDRLGNVLDGKCKEQLADFVSLYEKNKIGRIVTLIRGRYLKSDFIRIMGQFWYI